LSVMDCGVCWPVVTARRYDEHIAKQEGEGCNLG
jgi:hypothetical protein